MRRCGAARRPAPRRLWRRRRGGGNGQALGHPRSRRDGARRRRGSSRADADAGTRRRDRRRDPLWRAVPAVPERDRGRPGRAARLVLVRQRLRGRPERRRVPASSRRRRLVGLPRLGAGGRGTCRDRRVPRAVPARVPAGRRGAPSSVTTLRLPGAEAGSGRRSAPSPWRRSARRFRPAPTCSRCVPGVRA